MDLFLAICQGLGLALAVGVGGLLVPLFVGVLARADAGIDLTGTGWEFVESDWFLLLALGLNVIAYLSRERDEAGTALVGAQAGLGGVLFAASLAEEGERAWPGLVAGTLVAAGAAVLARDVIAGAARRAEGEATGALALSAAGTGLVVAALSAAVPPISIAFALGLLALAAARRRRANAKYAGLRSLR